MTSSGGLILFFVLLSGSVCGQQEQQKETLLGLPPLPAFFEDEEPITVKKPVRTTTPSPRKTANPFTLPVYTPLPPHRNFLFPEAPYLVNNIPELPPQHESKYKGRYDDDGVFHSFDEEAKEKKPQALGAKIQKTEDSGEEEADTDNLDSEGSPEATTTTTMAPQPRELHLPIRKLSALRGSIRRLGAEGDGGNIQAESSTSAPFLQPLTEVAVPELVQSSPQPALTSSIPIPTADFTNMIEVSASGQDVEKHGLPPLPTHPTLVPKLPEEIALHRDEEPLVKQSHNALDDGPLPLRPTARSLQLRKTSRSGIMGRRLQPHNKRKITTVVPQTQTFEQDNKITEPIRSSSTVTRKIQNTHPELQESNILRTTTQIPPRKPRPNGNRPFRRGLRPRVIPPLNRRVVNDQRPPLAPSQPLLRKEIHSILPQAQPLPPDARRPYPPPPPIPRQNLQLPPQPPGRKPEDAAFMRELEEYDWGLHQRQNNRINGRIAAKSQPTFENTGDAKFLRELEDYDDIDILEHQKHFTDNPPQLRVTLPSSTLPPLTNNQELVPLRNGDNFATNGNANNGGARGIAPNNNFNGNANQNGGGFVDNNNNNFLQNIFNPNVFGGQGGQGFFNGGGAQAVTPHPLFNVLNLFTFPQGRR